MIKIALEKWGYFNQIIFNTNKMAFESLPFPGSDYIKPYSNQVLNIARLYSNQDIR